MVPREADAVIMVAHTETRDDGDHTVSRSVVRPRRGNSSALPGVT